MTVLHLIAATLIGVIVAHDNEMGPDALASHYFEPPAALEAIPLADPATLRGQGAVKLALTLREAETRLEGCTTMRTQMEQLISIIGDGYGAVHPD